MLKNFLVYIPYYICILYLIIYIWRVCQKSQVVRPEGAEALKMNAFALTGRIIIISVYPGRCPGLGAIWAFSPHCLSFDTPSNLSQALIIPVIYSTSRYLG